MRSQKQNNRSPRPFKNQFSDRGRGGRDMGFIPGGKPVSKVKLPANKPADVKAEETPEASEEASSGEGH